MHRIAGRLRAPYGTVRELRWALADLGLANLDELVTWAQREAAATCGAVNGRQGLQQVRGVPRQFYPWRERIALAGITRFKRRAYCAALPDNWREPIEDLCWFWGWEPRVVMDMTFTEIRRWTKAAQRLGPRIVNSVAWRPKDK